MPTGLCNFPQHHDSPSGGPPLTLVLAILAGAGIVAYARTVVVVLAVVAVLVLVTGAVAMLWHSHRSVPYDAAWSEAEDRPAMAAPARAQERNPAVHVTQAVLVHPLAAGSASEPLSEALGPVLDRLERLTAAITAQQAIAPAPAQHLHLHGVSAADVAELVARPASRPALEEKS